MFCRGVVTPTRIKRYSTTFDGDWCRADAQRKVLSWQLFSLYSEDFFNFIQAKHKSLGASIFKDDRRRKFSNLSQKNWLKRPTFHLQRKQNKTLFSAFEHFCPKKNSGKIFSFQLTEIDKNCWRKTVESIFQFRCSWEINESKMKIEFIFRFVEPMKQNKIFDTQKSFLLFFGNRFRTKDFQIRHRMKRFFPIRIFKIYSKKKNQMNDVRMKDILDKIIFSSSNLLQIRQMFKWWKLFYQWIFHQIRRLNFD